MKKLNSAQLSKILTTCLQKNVIFLDERTLSEVNLYMRLIYIYYLFPSEPIYPSIIHKYTIPSQQRLDPERAVLVQSSNLSNKSCLTAYDLAGHGSVERTPARQAGVT